MGALMATAALVERTAFTAGEVDPLLQARQDIAKYQTGLKRLRNMIPMVEGGVTRRPGTRYVGTLKVQSAEGLLMPFEYARTDSYMLIFNAAVMRVMRNGGVVESSPGTPYEMATPFATADLPNIRYAQVGNQIFVAWGKKPRVIARSDHASWSVSDYAFTRGPLKEPNVTATTIYASGQTGTVTLTASASIFQAGHVGSIWRLDEKDLSAVQAWVGGETSLSAGNLRRNRGNIYSVVSGTEAGPNAPVHTEGDYASGQGKAVWRFETASAGYVRITGYTNATTVTAEVIDKLPLGCVGSGNATTRWWEGEWSDVNGWPTQVLFFENRLVWARGNKVWFTQLGDFYDFALTDADDSGIALALGSSDGRLVDVSWMLHSGVIVVGTDSSEWTLRGKEVFATITLANARSTPSGSEGSSPHRPLGVDGGVIFIGRSKKRLHFARFDAVNERVDVQELTLFARRMLAGGALGLAYQRDPNRLIWVRQANGELASLTFRPDQEVTAWAKHPMANGFVEDIAVIPSPDAATSEVWMIVRRTVNGGTVRYVEALQPFFEAANPDAPTATGAWFVDCGLAYAGAAATTISGLSHLAGQEVAILADGIEHRKLTVSGGGQITLDRAASSVIVGLPIVWRARLLPVDAALRGGPSRGGKKKTKQIAIERFESAGGFVSANDGFAEPLLLTGAAALSTPQPLSTGLVWANCECGDAETLEIEINGDTVYPTTLLGVSPRVTFAEPG
jgi:hypothetical protein